MTPTVPNLAKVVYEQLLAVDVWTTDHAIRVLALHADRTRLTREQLRHLIAQFEPRLWDSATMAAAERLVADRGEPAAALLAFEIGFVYATGRAGPWPPDAPASARCSCGRAPVQWLDGPTGPRTVPEMPTTEPAALSDAERVQVQQLADWLETDTADAPVNHTAVSSALRRMLGSVPAPPPPASGSAAPHTAHPAGGEHAGLVEVALAETPGPGVDGDERPFEFPGGAR